MPFITSSTNATVSGQASRRADQACAANAALRAFSLDFPKDVRRSILPTPFNSGPVKKRPDWAAFFSQDEFPVRPCR